MDEADILSRQFFGERLLEALRIWNDTDFRLRFFLESTSGRILNR